MLTHLSLQAIKVAEGSTHVFFSFVNIFGVTILQKPLLYKQTILGRAFDSVLEIMPCGDV